MFYTDDGYVRLVISVYTTRLTMCFDRYMGYERALIGSPNDEYPHLYFFKVRNSWVTEESGKVYITRKTIATKGPVDSSGAFHENYNQLQDEESSVRAILKGILEEQDVTHWELSKYADETHKPYRHIIGNTIVWSYEYRFPTGEEIQWEAWKAHKKVFKINENGSQEIPKDEY